MTDLTLGVVVVACATLLGPVLAVQAQKFVERATESRRRKLHIFYTLMTTRATRLANEHVQALNMIDMEFSSPRGLFHAAPSARDKSVLDAWHLYADHLNDRATDDPGSKGAWSTKSDDLFVDLLFALSSALGFNFDKVRLRRGIYYPVGHFEIETALRGIQRGLAGLLAGETSLPMRVVEFPISAEALELQMNIQRKMIAAFEDGGALKVTISSDDLAPKR